MKKQTPALLFIALMGLLSWGSAQGTRTDLFDAKKSQQELQIMKGILNTTLGFVASELRSREGGAQGQKEGSQGGRHTGESVGVFYGGTGSFWSGSNITAYYLYGQGATFIIPVSSLRMAFSRSGRVTAALEGVSEFHVQNEYALAEALESANDQMEAAKEAVEARRESIEAAAREAAEYSVRSAQIQAQNARAATSSGVAGGVGAGVGAGAGQAVAPAVPKPPVPPAVAKAPKAKQSQNPEELRKRLAEAQEKVKKRREEMEVQRQKLIQSLSEVKVYLIEALANHGDSLTHIKPNEYINIILTTDDGFPIYGEEGGTRTRRDVISVQKSAIGDYKAGRLSLEAFKQKVLQYIS